MMRMPAQALPQAFGLRLVFLALLVIQAMTMIGCSDADTLGDEQPVEFTINGEPTWENGMAELVSEKCGYCHAYPRPDIAPDNIVDDLDLNVFETRIVDGRVIRGADSIGRWIFEGILDQPVTQFADTSKPRAMPLNYGTPVTDREKAFFFRWSERGSPKDETPEPDDGEISRGRELYFGQGCGDCHSAGEGFSRDGEVIGPPVRRASLTVAKIQSMWLDKIDQNTPLSVEDAAAIRAFLLPLLAKN